MIKSLTYKLTKQPGTSSEEIFHPMKELLVFIENNNSRIFKIEVPNSKGKSFVQNLIAFAFFGLELRDDELLSTLRSSINFLIDSDHQKLEFKINLLDTDGGNLISTFDSSFIRPIVQKLMNNNEIELDSTEFMKNYKLIYDIPEKPLARIDNLIKSIKDTNSNLIGKILPIQNSLSLIISSLKSQRDESSILSLEEKVQNFNSEIESKNSELLRLKGEQVSLEIAIDLTSLKKTLIDLSQKENQINELNAELKVLPKPTGEVIITQDLLQIRDLKSQIEKLNLGIKIEKFLSHLKVNDEEINMEDIMSENEKPTLDKISAYNLNINDLFFENNAEDIAELLRRFRQIKDFSLINAFEALTKNLNVNEHNVAKTLIDNLRKFEKEGIGDTFTNEVFKKSISEVIQDIENYNSKFSQLEKIDSLKKGLDSKLQNILLDLKTASALGKKLFAENKKIKKAPENFKKYNSCKEKIDALNKNIRTIESNISSFRNNLETNKISKEKLNSENDINDLLRAYNNLNRKYEGKELENFSRIKGEITLISSSVSETKRELDQAKAKLNYEKEKTNSPYSANKDSIILISNKIASFNRWLNQKNEIIKMDGNLDVSTFEKNKFYIKLIGEFVANVMGNKVLYQNKEENISYIDYQPKTPVFVTDLGKRIAFSDLSTGQQSSNFLKSKLDLNEKRKHIVLLDEVSSMDAKSINPVIDRLKELERNGKLVLAILVEPNKSGNEYKIEAC